MNKYDKQCHLFVNNNMAAKTVKGDDLSHDKRALSTDHVSHREKEHDPNGRDEFLALIIG